MEEQTGPSPLVPHPADRPVLLDADGRTVPANRTEETRSRSFFSVLWSKMSEWRNVQSKDLDLQGMDREVELLEARNKLAAAKARTHETEAEADFLPRIRPLAEERRLRGLEAEIALEVEKVNQTMRKLRGGDGGALPSGGHEGGAACTSEEIDQIALKAAVRFGQMEPESAGDAWREWGDQVRTHYESNTAVVILQRATGYRDLAR